MGVCVNGKIVYLDHGDWLFACLISDCEPKLKESVKRKSDTWKTEEKLVFGRKEEDIVVNSVIKYSVRNW